MLFGIFAHVETLQGDAQLGGEHFGNFGLSYSGGAYKEQACQRFVFVQQSGFGHLHSFHHLTDGFFLPVDAGADAFVQAFQGGGVVLFHGEGIDFAGTCQYVGYQCLVHGLFLGVCGVYFPVSSCFVHQVDGFVGQETVADVAGACLYGIGDDVGLVGDAVVGFVFLFQAFYDMYGFFNVRFQYVYLLEAAYQSLAACEVAVVLVVGGRADETYCPGFQIGFQHVGGIHRAFARASGAYQVVYLVDVDDGVSLTTDAFHDTFQPLLEIAAILCACQ